MAAKYLVTGAAGFIASNVCRQLLDAGHEVIGWDNLNDAYDPALKRHRLADLQSSPGFAFDEVDIARPEVLRAPLQGVDGIFNLAARAGVRQSVEKPWVYIDTNTTGTLNLLELCRRQDIPRLVLASTSSLYGADTPRPFKESADTSRPLSPYAASKKGAEAMAASYTHLHGIHTPVFRYFTVYGPAGRPDMSVFRFIQWVREGRPITVYGDGSQERDFTYAADIARGTILGASVDGHEIINLGNDKPHSLRSLIALVEKHVGRKAQVQHKPMHLADVQNTWADISKARAMLNWSPTTDLEEGIRLTCEWHKANADLAKAIDVGIV